MAKIIRFEDIRKLLKGRKAEELAARIIEQSQEIHKVTHELRRFAFKIIGQSDHSK